jgi:hypothetical protein
MSMRVAALYVATNGQYFNRSNIDPWDINRDARHYNGQLPVVAHPPCNLWVNLAAVNWKRYQRQKPAWYPGGDDGGCFSHALSSIRRVGGVLEHPASTHAWGHYGLAAPEDVGWFQVSDREWTCEIWQSAYGHKARKRTWLYYAGSNRPFELNWTRAAGTHQIGWFDRKKPTLGKKAANATPATLASELIKLALTSVQQPKDN